MHLTLPSNRPTDGPPTPPSPPSPPPLCSDPAMPTLAVASALQRKNSDGILDYAQL